MSRWHREHPELAGTDADPWMHNPGHRAAYESLVREGHIDPPDDLPFKTVIRPSEAELELDNGVPQDFGDDSRD